MKENLTISGLFSESAANFREKEALQAYLQDRWINFKYGELQARSESIASWLLAEGFKKADTAVLILENRPEWPMIYLGIIYAGMTCVPIDYQLTPGELENLFRDCAAKVLFTSAAVFFKKNISGINHCPEKTVLLDVQAPVGSAVDFSHLVSRPSTGTIFPCVEPADAASLIYTSGTTALPKGVILTHANLCSNVRSMIELKIAASEDNFLSILPLHHTYAFSTTLLFPLLIGAKITYSPSLSSEDIRRSVKEGKVSMLVAVPQIFSGIHRAVFQKLEKIPAIVRPFVMPFARSKIRERFGSPLRMMVSGGARLAPETAADLTRLGFKLIEGYGLTETSPVVTLNPPQRVKFGSVGKPIPGVEIKIAQPDKEGVGEVMIKGPNVMQGYFKRPDLTAEAIKEGWFYSGDLGFIDKDGYLFLVGRKKDVIVLSSGKNIYPEELEDYYKKIPYIKEICILSKLEGRQGESSESLHAIIVPDLEYFRQRKEKNIRSVISWEVENLGKGLPSYQHIMGFTVVQDKFPRTRLNKIKRFEVAQRYLKEESFKREEEYSARDLKLLETDDAKKIVTFLRAHSGKPVFLDSHLEIDLGIDSLSRVELGLGLQKILGLRLAERVMESVSTPREIIIAVGQSRSLTPDTNAAVVQEKSWKEILYEGIPSGLESKIMLKPKFAERVFTYIFKSLFLSLLKIFWILRVRGKRNLPDKGPYLICPNHASYLDGFVVLSGVPFASATNLFFIGYAKIFEHPLVSWGVRLCRLIPIESLSNLTVAMQAAAYVLRNNKAICIFPEGRRSISSEIGEFKKGVGILSRELNIPIVPAYIKGSHQSWPRTRRFPSPYPLKIIFDRSYAASELQDIGRALGAEDDYQAIAMAVRQLVLLLKQEEEGRGRPKK